MSSARFYPKVYLEHTDENWLIETETKLQNSLVILEKRKSTLSRINYQDTCKTYGKTFRISNGGELISKIYNCATWSDKNNMLTGIINSLETSQATDFPKALKRLSSNIVAADMTNGPVSGTIIDKNKKFENHWYNILTKSVRLALRANAHFLNGIAKAREEIQKKQEEEEEKKQKDEEKRLKQEEQDRAKMIEDNLTKTLQSMSCLDSWEDF
jgi:hypothetical protein